tara:strand:+ start:381 stop:1031 length:651 start_codon:yes stop_codon:yes gene_type:complete
MAQKEFTKKQLRKQLTQLTEADTARSESAFKGDMKKSFDALKKLDQVTTGQKIGDVTITKAMNKKIKNAKRYIEDLWDKITDGEIEEKETAEGKEVEEKNEQSEGHGKMYNALEGVREGKVIKMNQSTLKRIVERVIKEQKNVSFDDMISKLSEAVTRIKGVSTTAWKKSEPALTDKELQEAKKEAIAELKSILDSYSEPKVKGDQSRTPQTKFMD